jgi:hypothetical protein
MARSSYCQVDSAVQECQVERRVADQAESVRLRSDGSGTS